MWLTANKKRIYLDYASATPMLPEAARALARAAESFGNPGAIHKEGVEAKAVLAEARARIASELACKARELVFVSGGTEANNLAILGFVRKFQISRLHLGYRGVTSESLAGLHWVTSSIEHPSVLECFSEVERLGGIVSYVEPDSRGIIRAESVERALRPETVYVSIQSANHEIGTIEPLREIKEKIAAHESLHGTSVIFHSDMGQTPLYRSPQVHGFGVDLATFDSGKLYGPRGIGCVYLSNRVELAPTILGGNQERGLRAGTENVALAAGFAESFSIISKKRDSEARRIRAFRDMLWSELSNGIAGIQLNGDMRHSLPHILNVSIPNISSEYVTLLLDHRGIAISTKSACREGEERRSHVVDALEAGSWRAANTLRFSLGSGTTKRDIDTTARTLIETIAKLRPDPMR